MRFLLTTDMNFAPAAPRTYADGYLDQWGEIFLANPQLRTLGVSFEQFLAQPAEILRAAVYHDLMPLPEHMDFYPPLPRQRAIRERLDAEAAGQLSLNLEERAA